MSNRAKGKCAICNDVKRSLNLKCIPWNGDKCAIVNSKPSVCGGRDFLFLEKWHSGLYNMTAEFSIANNKLDKVLSKIVKPQDLMIGAKLTTKKHPELKKTLPTHIRKYVTSTDEFSVSKCYTKKQRFNVELSIDKTKKGLKPLEPIIRDLIQHFKS